MGSESQLSELGEGEGGRLSWFARNMWENDSDDDDDIRTEVKEEAEDEGTLRTSERAD